MPNKQIERVVWRQGMLVSPQHLQQSEAFHEAVVDARIRGAQPYSWGLERCKIDQGLLRSGELKIDSMSAVMRDGLIVQFESGDGGAPPTRSISDYLTSTSSVLEVFVGVRGLRKEMNNYGEKVGNSRTRYGVSERTVVDFSDPDADLSVAMAHPNVEIVFGSEDREGFTTIKIAEIVRDSSGSPEESKTYVPPALNIDVCEYVANQTQELLGAMVVKQRILSEARRQRDASSVEFAARDVTRFLLLNVLNTHIPVLSHYVDEQTASPLTVYIRLCELAGQLTSFSADKEPTGFPKFRFTDLRSTFEPLFADIHEMLGTTIRDSYVDVPLEARQDGMWIGRLKDAKIEACEVFVLAVESDSPEQQVANGLPPISKIASWNEIGRIVRSSTAGVRIIPTHRPPSEIPIRPRQVYFMLSVEDEHWKTIRSERSIAIYLPSPYDPSRAKVTLMGVPPRPKS